MGLTSTIVLKLGTGTDPSRDTGHTVTTRAKYSGDAALLSVSLYQGATFITGVTHTLTTGFADYVIEVGPERAALITDYTDLRVWLTGSTVAHPAGTATLQVSWVELEYPAADGTQGLTVGLTQNLATTFGPEASGGSVQYLEPATAWNVDDTYAETYSESYGGGGPTAFDPSFDRVIDFTPTFQQQLVTVFGPNIKRDSDIDPALAQQLVTPFAPGFTIDIPMTLAQQLLSVFEDLTVQGAPPDTLLISTTRKQQLAAAFTPSFTFDVPVSLAQQLITTYAPTFTVDVTPGLQQQLVTTFAPTVVAGPLGLFPAAVQQLATVFAPTVAAGAVDVTPVLVQQLATTFAPEAKVSFGTITLVKQLITAFTPTITLGENTQVHFYLDVDETLEFEPDATPGFGSESVPAGSTGVGMGRG